MTTENVKNFGIEIECYNLDLSRFIRLCAENGVAVEPQMYNHTTTTVWKIVNDGSVRGCNACEIVSPILNGNSGLAQTKIICECLNSAGARVNKSCGLHVHHEARNLTTKQMKNLICMYARCESVIDKFMPASRRSDNNTYCKSMNHLAYQLRSGYRHIQGSTRYVKLNLQSWYRQGTVEFRQHSGTVEFSKISNWVIFTAQFLHTMKNRSSKSLKPAPSNCSVAQLLKITKTPTWEFYKTRIKALAA